MRDNEAEARKQAARATEGMRKASGQNYNPMLVDPMETNFLPPIKVAEFEIVDLKPKPKGRA